MKLIQYLLAFVIASASMSVYPQPSTETIMRFFEVTNTQKTLDSAFDQTIVQVRNMILQQDSWPDGYTDAKKLETANTVTQMTKDFLTERLGWQAQKDTFIALYKNHFTEMELIDAIAFYETESGRSMTEKLPAVTAEAMQETMALSMEMAPDLQKMISDYLSTLE